MKVIIKKGNNKNFVFLFIKNIDFVIKLGDYK